MSVNLYIHSVNQASRLALFLGKAIYRRRNSLTVWALIALLVLNPLCLLGANRKTSNLPVREVSETLLTHFQQDELSLAYLSTSDEVITLDKRQTDRLVLGIVGASNLRQRRLSELVGPSLGLLVEMYKLNGVGAALNPSELAQLFNLNRTNLSLAGVLPPKNALRVGMVTAAEIATTIGRTVPAVSQTIVEKINLEIRGDDFVKKTPINDVLRPLQYADLDPKVDEYLRGKLEEAYDLAQADASFQDIFAQSFAELLGERMSDSAGTAINKSPNTPDFVKSWIKPDGGISITSAEAMNRYTE